MASQHFNSIDFVELNEMARWAAHERFAQLDLQARKQIAELERIQEENRLLDAEELEMFGDTERVPDELLSVYDREPQLVDWESGGTTGGFVSDLYDIYDEFEEAA